MDEQKVLRPGVKKYRYSPKPGAVPRIPLPPSQLGGLNALGFIGMAAGAFFNYKLMLQQDAQRLQQEAMN